jgi:hypothetical protein
MAIERDLTLIGLDDIEDRTDRGRLAGTVGPEKTKELAATDFHGNTVNSDDGIEFFAKILDSKHEGSGLKHRQLSECRIASFEFRTIDNRSPVLGSKLIIRHL